MIFTEEIRRKKRRRLFLWLGFTSIFFIYISFLLTYFYKQWTTDCIRQLSVWLAVYEGIIVMQLARSLFLLHVWRTSKDPSLIQVQVDCAYSVIFLIEICWSIYGNTFIYSSGSQYCTGDGSENIDAFALWVSALILICWGYCLIIYLIGIIVFATALCCIYRSWSLDIPKTDSDKQHQMASNVPILCTMESYRVRKYNARRSSRRSLSQPLTAVDSDSCGLCMVAFRASDTVLDCHSGHAFHLKCF